MYKRLNAIGVRPAYLLYTGDSIPSSLGLD